MIASIQTRLLRWAIWYSSPNRIVAGLWGRTIEARIQEGRGAMLPGNPRGSFIRRPGVVLPVGVRPSDEECWITHKAIRRLSRKQQRFIRVAYLERGTVEAKAARLFRVPPASIADGPEAERKRSMTLRRKFYRKIDLLHSDLAERLGR